MNSTYRATPCGVAIAAGNVHNYVEHSRANTTRRAYHADWADVTMRCDNHDLPSLPTAPEAVALHITDLAESGRKMSTIQRRLFAIYQAHRLAGHVSPAHDQCVWSVTAGIPRMHGTAQDGNVLAERLIALKSWTEPPRARRQWCGLWE